LADLKISQLTDGGASQATDEYVVARSGSNFRIDGASVAAAATSVGTLSSLTVSGDLTVDTSTLKVDSTNNLVGIGGNPGKRLDVIDTASVVRIKSTSSTGANAPRLQFFHEANDEFHIAGGDGLQFYGSGTNLRMTLTGSGNLGLGVTPSAWATYTALQIKNGSIANYSPTQDMRISSNAYYTSGVWKRIAAAYATQYLQDGSTGTHAWFNAGTSTADSTITFTQAMTLDASGNLGVGTTVSSARVNVLSQSNGQGIGILNRSSDNNYGGLFFWTSDGVTNLSSVQNERVGTNGGNLLFYTKPDGGSITERARITSGGYFKASDAGTYVSSTGAYHELRSSAADNAVKIASTHASGPYGIDISYTAAAPNGTVNQFLYCADTGGQRASIRSNGGLANYQANNVDLSDIRTKREIASAASMWDKVAALEIVEYKYIDQTHDDVNLGVIAQQVETVEPVWVDADGFGDTPEGEEPFKTVYNKDIYFAAIKALQEAMARIEALEVEVAALKASA